MVDLCAHLHCTLVDALLAKLWTSTLMSALQEALEEDLVHIKGFEQQWHLLCVRFHLEIGFPLDGQLYPCTTQNIGHNTLSIYSNLMSEML